MKFSRIILLVLVIISCNEPIDLNVDTRGGELVIFGRISNSHVGNYVEITRTAIYEGAPEPVEGAEVKIYDEDGNMECLVMDEPGVYELVDHMNPPRLSD